MNTTEVKFNNQIKSFDELYKSAKDQFLMYEKIEGIDDWDAFDFSIDCSEDQMKFKDMLQIRFIEELTEASEALHENEEHFWEEVGDALNFFLSAYVMLGVDFNKFKSPQKILSSFNTKKRPQFKDFALGSFIVIEKVGFLCNLLKNRPWAQSNFMVSRFDFEERLNTLWETFWSFLNMMGVCPHDVFEMFYKKYQVNINRVESGY